jgi:hypothetical protein
MSVSTVLLSLLIIAVGILFAFVIRNWVDPAAGVLGQGIQAVTGLGGF